MVIKINLEKALAKRRMTVSELSDRVGVSETNLELLKKILFKDPRFRMVEKICNELHIQPDEILDIERDKAYTYHIT